MFDTLIARLCMLSQSCVILFCVCIDFISHFRIVAYINSQLHQIPFRHFLFSSCSPINLTTSSPSPNQSLNPEHHKTLLWTKPQKIKQVIWINGFERVERLRKTMSSSRPSVHPVEAPPLRDQPPHYAPRVRMKDLQGMPGTPGGLFLRISQMVFAAVSLSVMATTSDFPSVTAFS